MIVGHGTNSRSDRRGTKVRRSVVRSEHRLVERLNTGGRYNGSTPRVAISSLTSSLLIVNWLPLQLIHRHDALTDSGGVWITAGGGL